MTDRESLVVRADGFQGYIGARRDVTPPLGNLRPSMGCRPARRRRGRSPNSEWRRGVRCGRKSAAKSLPPHSTQEEPLMATLDMRVQY